jgi:hypothetical protein
MADESDDRGIARFRASLVFRARADCAGSARAVRGVHWQRRQRIPSWNPIPNRRRFCRRKVLFLEESGDHNPPVVDPQYPLFVLGGVIVDKDHAEGELTAQLNRFKEEALGSHDIQGTRFLQAKAIARQLLGLDLRDKSENVAGLQLADLVVSPIGRHVLDKPPKEDWSIVESKLRRGPKGSYEGYGLVVLPK